jgi:hypothetical protein
LGTGSNYVNANTTTDPTLAFAAGEQVKTMSSGYEWTLTNSSSTHTCLAVEINTTNDPVVTPTLIGRAPGWPDTDLSVLYDNNKGQRNMGVYSVGAAPGGSIIYYAILHNAATYLRDFVLHFKPNRYFIKNFKNPEFVFPATEHDIIMKDDHLVIPGMKPGENQWIGIKVPATGALGDEMAVVDFVEVVDNIAVNGFGIGIKAAPAKQVLFENYYLHAEVFFRMGNIFGFKFALEESEIAIEKLIKNNAGPLSYFEYMKSRADLLIKAKDECIKNNNGNDPFTIEKALQELLTGIETGDPDMIIVPHAEYNHKMDAFLTYLDKKKGDLADILQNIRWQIELYNLDLLLNEVNSSKALIEQSTEFHEAYSAGKIGFEDYPEFINRTMNIYEETVEVMSQHGIKLSKELRAMINSVKDPKKLQKAHYNFLLKLNTIR